MVARMLIFFRERSILIKAFTIALISLIILLLILPGITKLTYSFNGFLIDVYPEIFGLLLDVILFGLVITLVQFLIDRGNDISKELDQIDDFRGWKAEEASHRILGCIKRLQRVNYTKIELSQCHILKMTLKDIEFSNSKMNNVCFNDSTFYNCTFESVMSNHFVCCDGLIQGTHFKNERMVLFLHRSDIGNCLFHKLDAHQSIFQKVKLSFTLFDEVDLSHSNLEFKECKFTEFKNCIFDEARVSANWFEELEKPDNHNLGISEIKQKYDIVESEEPSQNGPTKVLVLRKKGQVEPTKKPPVVIKPENTIVLRSPWTQLGRCQPF